MKNLKKILLVVLVVTMGFLVTGCSKKTAISSADFKSKMESKNFYVQSVKPQFAAYDFIKEVYVAQKKDKSFQVEFYELSTDDHAINFFDNNKKIFEASKADSSSYSSVDLDNHSKYTLNSNKKYKVISRINNTVFYADVPDSYKEEVKTIEKELGY